MHLFKSEKLNPCKYLIKWKKTLEVTHKPQDPKAYLTSNKGSLRLTTRSSLNQLQNFCLLITHEFVSRLTSK